MREPSVSVQIIAAPSYTSNVSGEDLAAGAVVAPNGPIKPTSYSSKQALLKAFTRKGKIERSTHTTVIHAAAVIETMPIVVCRAFEDEGARYGVAVYSTGTCSEPVVEKAGSILSFGGTVLLHDSITSDTQLQVGNTVYQTGTGTTSGITYLEIPENELTLKRFIHEINLIDRSHHIKIVRESTTPIEYSGVELEESVFAELFIYANNEAELGIKAYESSDEENDLVVSNTDKTKSFEFKGTNTAFSYMFFMMDLVQIEVANCLFYLFANDPNQSAFKAALRYPDATASEINTDYLIALDVNTLTRDYHYEGSLDEDYLNKYQVNQFIENVNDYEGIEWHIVVNKEFADAIDTKSDYFYEETHIDDSKGNKVLSTFEFGADSSVSMDEPSLASYEAAMEKIVDADEFEPTFLLSLGKASFEYAKKLAAIGQRDGVWAFVPFGIIDKTKSDDASVIAEGISKQDYYNLMVMAPHDLNTGIADFIVPLSAEVAYLKKYVSNRALGAKFAPIMGETNGSLNFSKPSVVLSRSTRETLLDKGIMSVIVKRATSQIYLNKNKAISTDATFVLSEDQNCRLAYQLNRDYTTLCKQFLGKYNTVETRSQVVSILSAYNSKNIWNQIYTPVSIRIQCDENNNTTDIIAANKLVVDVFVVYNKTIYEVNIYHRVYDLSNAPTEE